MMTKVWKYVFPRNIHEVPMQIPAAGKILSVQSRNRDIVMWVQVPSTEEKQHQNSSVARYFQLIETGKVIEVDDSMLQYIGTVQVNEGYVLHIFEIIS